MLLTLDVNDHHCHHHVAVQGLASVEDTLERQLLSEPVDRELQAAYTLTDIGPRVAVCCGLYQLAEQAGLVQHSDPDNNDNSISRDVDYQWVAAVEAAGVVLWQNWLQVRLDHCLLTAFIIIIRRFLAS